MKKLSTLYKKDPNDLGRVINVINPENAWVFTDGIPTRKFDGTACMILNGVLYKRYDCRIDKETGEYKKPIPEGAISCQEPDKISGHHPHWIMCNSNNPNDRWYFVGFEKLENKEDGTYELCGEKVQGNPEKINRHELIKHGSEVLPLKDFRFHSIKMYLESVDIEGIVFHHKSDDRMCKIRKADFGIRRD